IEVALLLAHGRKPEPGFRSQLEMRILDQRFEQLGGTAQIAVPGKLVGRGEHLRGGELPAVLLSRAWIGRVRHLRGSDRQRRGGVEQDPHSKSLAGQAAEKHKRLLRDRPSSEISSWCRRWRPRRRRSSGYRASASA